VRLEGQRRGEGSGGGRGVSQSRLAEAPVPPGVEPRGRPGVAPRVHRGALRAATGRESGPNGILHTRAWQGLGGR
jgi:hypothetical protein